MGTTGKMSLLGAGDQRFTKPEVYMKYKLHYRECGRWWVNPGPKIKSG